MAEPTDEVVVYSAARLRCLELASQHPFNGTPEKVIIAAQMNWDFLIAEGSQVLPES